jgi:syntaxin-binding protein 1
MKSLPVLQELIEKLSKGELPKDEYNCMNDPSPSAHGPQIGTSVRTSPAHSIRSRRTGGTWARSRDSDDGYSRLVVDIHTEIILVREKRIFL